MKIRDIINNVEKSNRTQAWVSVEELATELGLGYGDYASAERLTSYYFGSWMCTDTTVGYKVYFLDDKPIAVSYQGGRKSDENFYWISEEIAMEVRSYIISLLEEKEDSLNVSISNLDEDIGDGFTIDYYGQIDRFDNARLNDQPVKLVKPVPESYNLGTRTIVELPDGTTKEVATNELTFSYFLKEEVDSHD